ncbi:SDR family NAD(P)-dependent oxidoreductase [Gramella sp. AN32]|uniref:SDR family NAD(P)-dependent oxidoreductase n=1 Tax=Christiangramia antarctica TaxID=2058158 RepID=A0ABW5X5Y8_9FLAO|nr:SDR family NAD(P)-dependent oxidoreductase [Gramella sp. AN32]MCM4155755.1 3-oxoacyl-ACP reductase [Gramella sp. AN32]
MEKFSGQVAVITGAASGIGLGISKKLLESGAKIALLDIDQEGLEEAFKDFKNSVMLYSVNITHSRAVEGVLNNILDEWGQIDILINCAGMTGITNTQSHLVDEENLREVFELNFMGAFMMTKLVIPHMLDRNYGRILHLASIAGKEGNAGMLAYSASKAAVIGMTKVQGKEYAETGITVNALAPAVIKTPLVEAMPDEQVTYMTEKIPMKRCGTLAEVADTALYIVSRRNSFTTGFTFDLSGGRATY